MSVLRSHTAAVRTDLAVLFAIGAVRAAVTTTWADLFERCRPVDATVDDVTDELAALRDDDD